MTATPSRATAEMLQGIVDLLNATGHPYCMLHGYGGYPERIDSDVDCAVAAELLPHQLPRLIDRDRASGGPVLVQWLQHEATAHYFVLAAEVADEAARFLAVDFSSDYRARGRSFYSGPDLLARRQRWRDFWVPPPAVEFGYCLVKRIGKGTFGDDHARRLSELYQLDPSGCRREIERFWPAGDRETLLAAAAGDDWTSIMRTLPTLRRHLLAPTAAEGMRNRAAYWLHEIPRRARRWSRPTGLFVVLLGPDGAGKSTISAAVRERLAPVFRRVGAGHFGPDLLGRAAARGAIGTSAPHAQRPRAPLASLAKCLYWLLDFSVGYWARIRPALVRSTFLVYDRYLLDALVDPYRYRFGGPQRLIRAVWRLVPKPDLVILLDASVAALHARKQELTVSEIERQRSEYRALVASLPNGAIVNAEGSVEQVAANVERVILAHLERRTADRLGLRE